MRRCVRPGLGQVALAAAMLLVVSACGNRLSHDEIVAAAGGQPADQTGAPGSPAGGDSLATTVLPGYPPPGASDGSPGTGAELPAQGGDITGAPPAAAGATVTIGSVGNYSGPAGNSQAPGAKALQAWVQFVNSRGGVAGHPIKLVVVDDGSDPARHQAALRDLVEKQGVVAFVANLASITAGAGRAYLEEKGVPVIGGEVSTEIWYQSPVFYPQGSRYRSLIAGMVRTGAQLGNGKKKLGVLTCQEAEVCTAVDRWLIDEGLAKQGGLDPVYRAKMSLTQPDFTAECLAARNAGVEILSVTGDPNTVGRVYASCARQNFRPILLQHSATVDNKTQLLDSGKVDVVLVTLTFPWVTRDTPATKEYQDAMKQYNVEPSAATSLGWASGKLFERVLVGISGEVTTQRVRDGLWSLQNERLGDLTPPLTFPRDRTAVDSGCWFTMRAQGGRWTAPEGSQITCP